MILTDLLWETEAVEIGIDISMAVKVLFWLIVRDSPSGGKVQQGCLARKTRHALFLPPMQLDL
jgi:hypothetical protein